MRKFGLIGYPLGHSWSKDYWTEFFQQEQLKDHDYLHFELPTIDYLPEILRENKDLVGLNVTIPYKVSVLEYCDMLSPAAEAIGAVNTLWRTDEGLIGYNTDASGFQKSIRPFLQPKHEHALVFGTGGSALAIAYILKNIGINVHFVSRMPLGQGKLAYKDINAAVLNSCKLIVNCTPLGMAPNSDRFPDIPYHLITPEHLVVDLIYNPVKTLFLQKAEEQGATILNGKDMLHFQAQSSWNCWNGEEVFWK
ncbi:MAG: shikimate dehydrogenase [Flavobacteriales bacterium]|nr:shikimate dehydrogenase [Flavobacteriales bacterium]